MRTFSLQKNKDTKCTLECEKTILANTCFRVLNGELNDRKQKVDMNKQLTEIYRAINIKSNTSLIPGK